MRKQPLLALASTALALSTAGTAVAEVGGPQTANAHPSDAHAQRGATEDASPAAKRNAVTSATLVTDLRTAEATTSFTATVHGDYALAAVAFAVSGAPVLGTWQSPVQRYLARRHALLLERRAAALARARHAALRAAALRRHAAWLRRLAALAAAARRHTQWVRELTARRHAAWLHRILRRRHAAWLRRLREQRHASWLHHLAARRHDRRYEPLGGVWAALRSCESGGNYLTDTGNGYYGAYQFSLGTWQGLGFSGLPSQAPPALQDQAAMRLETLRGWSPWPVCSAALGL